MWVNPARVHQCPPRPVLSLFLRAYPPWSAVEGHELVGGHVLGALVRPAVGVELQGVVAPELLVAVEHVDLVHDVGL